MIKCHDQGNLESKAFNLALDPEDKSVSGQGDRASSSSCWGRTSWSLSLKQSKNDEVVYIFKLLKSVPMIHLLQQDCLLSFPRPPEMVQPNEDYVSKCLATGVSHWNQHRWWPEKWHGLREAVKKDHEFYAMFRIAWVFTSRKLAWWSLCPCEGLTGVSGITNVTVG